MRCLLVDSLVRVASDVPTRIRAEMREKPTNAFDRKRISRNELHFIVLFGNGVIRLNYNAIKDVLVAQNTNAQPKIVGNIDNS